MIVNPFKFGTVVDGNFFTNRKQELLEINKILNSSNHLILISPRRYGKTSLIKKAVYKENRKSIFLDIQLASGIEDFAAQYLKRIYSIYPMEKMKHLVKYFKVMPTINLNPTNNEIEVSFQADSSHQVILEDVLNLLEQLSTPNRRAIVVLDEFQDINRLGKGLDRILRSILQHHKNINYIFLGSQESMMRDIFEKKKSPFYHFGQLMYLNKIEHTHFCNFIAEKLNTVSKNPQKIATELLDFTNGHPYYTQQMAYHAWNLLSQENKENQLIKKTINEIVLIHDLDYERIWYSFNSTDKKTLIGLTTNINFLLSSKSVNKLNIKAPSTVFSSLKRLTKLGYIIKTGKKYEIDDPFFREWIIQRRKG